MATSAAQRPDAARVSPRTGDGRDATTPMRTSGRPRVQSDRILSSAPRDADAPKVAAVERVVDRLDGAVHDRGDHVADRPRLFVARGLHVTSDLTCLLTLLDLETASA